jgi:O-antigen ligase
MTETPGGGVGHAGVVQLPTPPHAEHQGHPVGDRHALRGRALVRPLVAVATMLLAVLALFVEPVLSVVMLLVPTLLVLAERCRRDAVTVLTVFLVLLAAIPSGLVIGPLGGAGRPSMLIGTFAAWWWVHASLLPDGGVARGFQPVRVAGFVFAATVVASYAAAYTRPIDGDESLAADRGVLYLVALMGVLLLAADGIATRERLETLLRRLVAAGAVLALVGILQFRGLDLSGVFRFPFLSEISGLAEVQARGTQRRVSATAAHPIEFGVVLALIFPIALHYALYARKYRAPAVAAMLLIAVAIPMSVSRSGTLALAVTFFAMWITWPYRLKIRSALLSALFIGLLRFAVPGLLGTIRYLFLHMFEDDSYEGRRQDYSVVGDFIKERAVFGRGFGTFLPEKYVYLDNQYLGFLVEIGILGSLAFLVLLIVGIGTARGARRLADEETRSLGQALSAAIFAAAITAATFDLIGFGIVSGLLFLILGCAGALWRLTAPRRAAAETSGPAGAGGDSMLTGVG